MIDRGALGCWGHHRSACRMTAAPVNEATSYSATVGRFELPTPRRRNADGGSLDPAPGPGERFDRPDPRGGIAEL
jgi:hypothetical protein